MGTPRALAYLAAASIGCAWLCTATGAHAENSDSGGFTESTAPSEAQSEGALPEETDAQALAEQAKVEFNRGNQAYEQGNYRKAAEAFEQAHRLSPHSAVLFNAARAWWKMGESERAADDYAEAIRRGELTSEQTLRARNALASLRKKLGWVIVSGAPGTTISVGHRIDASLPLITHLAPGDHVLHVLHDGDSWEQLVTIEADSPRSVVAQKERLRDEIKEGPRPAAPPPPVAQNHAQNTWGWATLGVGTALGAGAVVTGLFTLNSRNEFNTLNDGTPGRVNAARARRDETRTWQAVTNVLAISGGAAALTGFTLLLTAPRNTASKNSVQQASLTIWPGQFEMIGRF